MKIKEKIIWACRNLARSKGFYSPTMDELAAEAGVSKRTVYRYFHSKEEIIETTLESFMQEIYDFVQNLLAQNLPPEETLSQLIKTLLINGQFIFNPPSLEDLRIHYPFLWQRIDQFRMQRIREVLANVVENSDKEQLHQINPRLLAAVIQASIQATINPDFLLSNQLNFEDAVMQLSKFWIAALF